MLSRSGVDSPLENYPKLWAWYRKTQLIQLRHNHEILVFNLARSLSLKGQQTSKSWMQTIDTFLMHSTNPLEDFLFADSFADELKAPLTQILSELCEDSILTGNGMRAFSSIQALASRTNLSALRFLSAWIALNNGDFESCIEECEKELEPHANIYTLLGQAQLESGNAEDAIDSFKISIKLNPNDPMTLFQLVKAYLVVNQIEPAIQILTHCRSICEDNIEIECLAALTAISDQGKNRSFLSLTAERLTLFFEKNPGDLDLMCLAFNVHEILGDQTRIRNFFSVANFSLLAAKPKFHAKMSAILRKLGERGWFAISQNLANEMIKVS